MMHGVTFTARGGFNIVSCVALVVLFLTRERAGWGRSGTIAIPVLVVTKRQAKKIP